MALPIYSVPAVAIHEPDLRLTKNGWRQAKPYDRPLLYHHARANARGRGPGNTGNAWRYHSFASEMGNESLTYNKAYSSFVRKLGEPAGIGITLAQWKQADQMISKRASQLTSFTGALARRNPLGVAASLGLSLRDVRRVMGVRYGTARKLSDLWLEFWFGWKPLVNDIYTACEVFDREPPAARFKGRGSTVWEFRQYEDPSNPVWINSEFLRIAGSRHYELGADVRIVNPNAFLLNQFGLLNPMLVAWDAIPWSFVLDWFANVNSWLASFTDFAGLETSNGYVTSLRKASGYGFWAGSNAFPPGTHDHAGSAFIMDRFTLSSVPRPRLTLKEFSLKPVRALTAITLLSQKLPSR